MTERTVAVLVDGDNVSTECVEQLEQLGENLGRITTRRAYGNARVGKKWDELPGYLMMQVGSGKNGADVMLAVDAMDLFHQGRVEAFVIASGDSDISHLVNRLLEMKAQVVWCGEAAKSGERASRHKYFQPLVSAASPKSASLSTQELNDIIAEKLRAQREMTLSWLGKTLKDPPHNYGKDQLKREHDAGGWGAYLDSHPSKFERFKKETTDYVRLRAKS